MEGCMEYLIQRKRSPIYGIACNLFLVLGILLALFGFLYWPGLIAAIVFIVIWFLLYRVKLIEFEYLYLDREITVDRIVNQRKRKTVQKISLKEMSVMAPWGSSHLGNVMGRTDVKVTDFSKKDKKTEKERYVIVMDSGEQFILEPSPEFIKMAQSYLPSRKIFTD